MFTSCMYISYSSNWAIALVREYPFSVLVFKAYSENFLKKYLTFIIGSRVESAPYFVIPTKGSFRPA